MFVALLQSYLFVHSLNVSTEELYGYLLDGRIVWMGFLEASEEPLSRRLWIATLTSLQLTTVDEAIGARTADGLHRERLLERDRLGRVADVDDEFAGIHAPVLCVHVVVAEGALVQMQDDVLCLAGLEANFAELL